MQLSRLSLFLLLFTTCIVTWTSLVRYQDPVGEKYIYMMQPGAADFFIPFAGARAYVMGENPYLNDKPELTDPWHRGYRIVDGVQYRALYPPAHIMLYVPLAAIVDDWRLAGRIIFSINMAALLILAVIIWRIVVYITALEGTARKYSTLLIPVLFIILATNIGTSLGLERGDGGDVLGAAMVWGGIMLFLLQWPMLAMFLMTSGTLIKGYGALLVPGIFLLGFAYGNWRRQALGALLALIIFIVPMIPFLPDAVPPLMGRVHQEPWHTWFNHSFRNFFANLSPSAAVPGKWVSTGLTVAVTVACWFATRRAFLKGADREAAFWLVCFATCALIAVVGFARLSIIYNLIFVIPGVLAAFLLPDALIDLCRLPKRASLIVGGGLVIIACTFFTFRFWSQTLPTATIGLLAFVVLIGGCMLGGKWIASTHSRHSSPG